MTDEKRKELITNVNKIANFLILKKTSEEYKFSFDLKEIELAFSYYEDIKVKVKKYISDEEFKQDRHKVAATLIIALLSVMPIKINNHPQEITEEEAKKWINEILSIAVVEYTIRYFLENKDFNFKYPPTTSGKPYTDYLIALVNSMNNDISYKDKNIPKLSNYILSLSHIFYFIEQYNL